MTTEFAALARQRLRGELLADEPLALHTSLRVGGPADIFAAPADLADLRELMRLLAETGTAYLVIGGGYNLLVRDGGFRGVAISLKNLRGMEEHPGNLLSAGAGVTNGALVRCAEERCLAGLEFLIGHGASNIKDSSVPTNETGRGLHAGGFQAIRGLRWVLAALLHWPLTPRPP